VAVANNVEPRAKSLAAHTDKRKVTINGFGSNPLLPKLLDVQV
jgi:hypothetical protein